MTTEIEWNAPSWSLRQAANHYLKSMRAAQRSPHYLAVVRSTLRQWVLNGNCSLVEAAGNVDGYLARRLSPLSLNSRYMEVHRLRKFLDYCVEHKWLDANPLREFRTSKPKPTEIKVLTDDEIRRLLEAAGDLEYAAITLLLGSGMGLGELLKLEWGDVRGDEILVSGEKGKQRFVAPGQVALAALRSLPRTGHRVFPLSMSAFKARLGRLGDMAGVHFSPQILRHAFCDRFIAAGGTIEELSAILGHISLNTTMLYLRHRQPHGRALEAQRRLNPADALLGQGGTGI